MEVPMAAQNESQLTGKKVLLTWKSPSRPFKKRNREYFTTIGAIVFLIAVILLLLKEFLLIGAILALMFVSYVLETTEPEIVEHSILTDGLVSLGHTYKWEELDRFWFTERRGQVVLTIAQKLKAWGRIIVLVPADLKEKVKNELQTHLIYQEKPEKSWSDNFAEWLAKKVPLETEN